MPGRRPGRSLGPRFGRLTCRLAVVGIGANQPGGVSAGLQPADLTSGGRANAGTVTCRLDRKATGQCSVAGQRRFVQEVFWKMPTITGSNGGSRTDAFCGRAGAGGGGEGAGCRHSTPCRMVAGTRFADALPQKLLPLRHADGSVAADGRLNVCCIQSQFCDELDGELLAGLCPNLPQEIIKGCAG